MLLVSSKARSTPLYKGLSARFSRQLTFGEARDTDEAVKQALGVTKSPQLLLLPAAKGAEPVPYTGAAAPTPSSAQAPSFKEQSPDALCTCLQQAAERLAIKAPAMYWMMVVRGQV